MGQAAEGLPVVVVRGLAFSAAARPASALICPREKRQVQMSAPQGSSSRNPRPVALCGGVGGAKLALGLERLYGEAVAIVVNTGDDFGHLGLHVSPDIDTVLYTLGGRSDLERGWGRAGETWQFMEALRELGGETWFQLGDLDLAMHVERTRKLRAGITLTAFTRDVAADSELPQRSCRCPMTASKPP